MIGGRGDNIFAADCSCLLLLVFTDSSLAKQYEPRAAWYSLRREFVRRVPGRFAELWPAEVCRYAWKMGLKQSLKHGSNPMSGIRDRGN